MKCLLTWLWSRSERVGRCPLLSRTDPLVVMFLLDLKTTQTPIKTHVLNIWRTFLLHTCKNSWFMVFIYKMNVQECHFWILSTLKHEASPVSVRITESSRDHKLTRRPAEAQNQDLLKFWLFMETLSSYEIKDDVFTLNSSYISFDFRFSQCNDMR